jgi:hypothetical protein
MSDNASARMGMRGRILVQTIHHDLLLPPRSSLRRFQVVARNANTFPSTWESQGQEMSVLNGQTERTVGTKINHVLVVVVILCCCCCCFTTA